MSSEHKAYVFDFQLFKEELSSILNQALLDKDASGLIGFIDSNIADLINPYTEEAMSGDWQSYLEIGDIDEYGDFAITKYYDLEDDIGLGYNWLDIQNILVKNLRTLEGESERQKSPILGNAFGPENKEFDPGKLGSYFQSRLDVSKNINIVNSLLDLGNNIHELSLVRDILLQAHGSQRGLYVTF